MVTGSRNYDDFNEMYWILKTIVSELKIEPSQSAIIHGNSRGADKIAGYVGRNLGFNIEVYPANWDKYGKVAGPIRNREMVNSGVDLVLAFPIGNSYGTRNAIKEAKKKQIPIINVTKNSQNEIIEKIKKYKSKENTI